MYTFASVHELSFEKEVRNFVVAVVAVVVVAVRFHSIVAVRLL